MQVHYARHAGRRSSTRVFNKPLDPCLHQYFGVVNHSFISYAAKLSGQGLARPSPFAALLRGRKWGLTPGRLRALPEPARAE